jgi:hypothetical protein
MDVPPQQACPQGALEAGGWREGSASPLCSMELCAFLPVTVTGCSAIS